VIMILRYIVMADEYDHEGWKSYQGEYANLTDAVTAAKGIVAREDLDWWEVIDLMTKTVVEKG
jgi:hypothetical protein